MSSLWSNRSEQPRLTAARSLALGTVAGSLLAAGCASRSAPLSASSGATGPGVVPVTQVRPLMRIEPNEVEAARLADAQSAADAEDYDTALRIFRELLQDNPTLAPAYTGIGEALENKGEIELAEPAYARAVSLDPTDFTAMSGHGRVLEALGRTKEAIRAL
ncbi:MAG: tetratricopeptide repeat protein, partial [bacterium]